MPKVTGLVATVGLLLTPTAAIVATHVAMSRPASAHEDHGNFSAGQPGDPKKSARVVNIKMFEGSGKMGYEPARIEVRRGEQIRFVLQNDGEEDHEFILATVAENRKHAEVMKKNPDMEHDDPNAKRLLPHGHGEIVWKFTKRGTFEFACLIPGHYEKGMFGRITVK
jgi:uncharacterized cupredoxin-like copper-binding protein